LNGSGLFHALKDKMGSEDDEEVEGNDLMETTSYLLTNNGDDTSQNAIESYEAESQSVEYEENKKDEIFRVKACDCKIWLMEQDAYCPADFDHCSVSSEWWGDNVWINCYHETVITSYARYVWKYVTVIFAMLTLIFCCSRPGHNGIKYFLSSCFPSLNRWIVEEILQNEIATRNQRYNEVTESWRRTLREEGYVTGYKLKTKVFRSGSRSTREDDGDDDKGPHRALTSLDEETPPILDDDNIDDETLRQSSPEESAEFVSSKNQDSNFCNIGENFSRVDDEDDDVQTCSICLLSFEDGDRVADLNCNHHFHAECISEWVRKKNKCPLCQAEGIAEEIRTFDDRALLPGHLNFSDTNNLNHPLDANVQNNGNDNESGNTDDNDGAETGMAYNDSNIGSGTSNGSNGTLGEGLEEDEQRFASRAHRVFRKKVRPIVMGVNSADLVTA